ncbi:hypothetical protein M2A_1617 [Tepidicaulis marinus]|uniref:Uncharacterized protein n=1 Tax=Tepidicaulis marinus TaxID=1333998 RepID=A0A081BAQ0_9HYPH|nr:hypothetical protein M2A_1617 [Tepidicaulis marinus]
MLIPPIADKEHIGNMSALQGKTYVVRKAAGISYANFPNTCGKAGPARQGALAGRADRRGADR